MKKQITSFFKGFKYATNGILEAVKQERNLRFHLVAAVYVYLFSLFYDFSKTEYLIITVLVGVMLALEIINSAIERAVAKPDKIHDAYAGLAKDMGAGAVLVFAITSAVVAVILFWDTTVFNSILNYFVTHVFAVVALIISIILSILFIFRKEDISVEK